MNSFVTYKVVERNISHGEFKALMRGENIVIALVRHQSKNYKIMGHLLADRSKA